MRKNTTILIFPVFLIFLLSSCYTYYKSRNVPNSSLDSLSKTNRVFILRSGNEALLIRNMIISEDKKTASCQLDLLPGDHIFHLSNTDRSQFKYKKSLPYQHAVINEVHFYIPMDTLARPGRYALNLSNISRIEILEHDKKRTTNSHVIGAVAITIGVAAAVLVIAAALKSSCPFISAWDGREFSLQGEIYGGSIYPQLERKDYLSLKMAPDSGGDLQLRITNELKERQFTDYVKLWAITHPEGTSVMVDEFGNLHSISAPAAPVTAIMNNHINVLPHIDNTGDNLFCSLDDTTTKTGVNELILSFRKPPEARTGKLVLVLKNSYFLDLLYAELAKGFGTYYATYMKTQKKKSREELLRWVREQHIPLEIAVKTEKGWQPVSSLTTVGPLAFRETAIEIPVSGTGEGLVQVSLKCGFRFWEIDFAGMDFTGSADFSVDQLSPFSAIDEKGKNILPVLGKEDGKYLDQPEIGNAATILFKSGLASPPGSRRTYILETKGYYEHLRDFKTPPDKEFLEPFKKPGAFPLFGIRLFKRLESEKMVFASSY